MTAKEIHLLINKLQSDMADELIEECIKEREELAWEAARKVWYGHFVDDYNSISATDLTYQSIEDWRKEEK